LQRLNRLSARIIMKSSFNTKFKALVLVAGLAAGFGAQASSTVTFDPAGNSANNITDVSFTTLDQRPGNALAIGASAGSGVGTNFNLLYQANLGSALNGNGDAVFNQGAVVGGLARNFTFVAGFSETVTGNTVIAGNGVLTFGFGASNANAITATNFFYMYAQGASGNNLAGTGFAGVAPILSGHFISTNYASTFTATGAPAGNALDQAGSNDYPGVTSLNGAGSTTVTLVIDSFNSAYFPNLVVGATSSLINTSQNLAFAQVDPSALFSSNGIANGDTAGVASVGAVNGVSGRNTMFQADANQSFTTGVPEPMPAALIGLGLVALGLVRRKAAK
jgi:hypothetical protein